MKRHYHWVIAGAALFTLFVTNGITIGGLSVFDESLLQTFGWTRGALKFRDLLTLAIAGLIGPLAGALADRFGVRPLMAAGALVLALGMALYARIGSVLHMYAIHVLFAVVLASCGLIVAVMLVSRWFVSRRGTALGITLVGTSLGGFVMPQVGAWLIESRGWRGAFLAEGLLPVILLLVILFVIRERPEDVGLRALGADAAPGRPQGKESDPLPGMTFREALRTRTFWAITVTSMMTFYAILGVAAHVFLHLRGQGFEPAAAARGISWLFLMGLIGKFFFGFLADRFDHKRVLMGNLAIMLLGSLALASMRREAFWFFAIFFGVGWGGLYTLLQLVTVESFGLLAAGKIIGTRTILDALGGGLGPWLTGVLFDRTGSYLVPFWVVTAMVFLGMIVATQVRREVASAPVREAEPTTASN